MRFSFFFFFNDTATTEIYTLSLHDALPISDDAAGAFARDVAQHPLGERQVLVKQRRRWRSESAAADAVPELAQVLDVTAQLRLGRVLRHGADDEASGLAFGQQQQQLVAQELTLGLVLDPLRNADVGILGKIDDQPPGDRDLGRKPRALGADRILDHLHEQRLALGEDFLDRLAGRAVDALPLLPDVCDVQERGALEADLDESRLHSRQDARDFPHVDVSDQAPARRALDVQLLRHARLHHGDASLLRRAVDQDVLRHTRAGPAAGPRGLL